LYSDRVRPTFGGEKCLERLAVMTALQIFAFYINPIIVVAVVLGGAWLSNRDLKRRDRMHPGE
jgi:hypothetical protein